MYLGIFHSLHSGLKGKCTKYDTKYEAKIHAFVLINKITTCTLHHVVVGLRFFLQSQLPMLTNKTKWHLGLVYLGMVYSVYVYSVYSII